ncbi:MAG: PhzF family phenazine biosynthesis protein [Spirochaetales bacterium]|nr:MAG: PhzF family phenazine biosynthesis protein [Spirochaetales bacterium]
MRVGDFEILDVFAERPGAGNQLAVVFASGKESTGVLQRVAREFNFSETVFLPAELPVDPANSGVPTRIFTPMEELPFAGHPTLGASWVVRRHTGAKEVILSEGVGDIHTWYEGDRGDPIVWMRQREPEYLEFADPRAVAAALCLQPDDVSASPAPQRVSTGLAFLLVPLASRNAVARARINSEALADIYGVDAPPVLLFAREAEEPGHQIRARMYAPHLGIPEDPATGSAAGCLVAYLLKHRLLGDSVDAVMEQGYEMGRPSVLHLSGRVYGAHTVINVGGAVQLVATGSLVSFQAFE